MRISVYNIRIKFWYLCTKNKIFNILWFYLKKILSDPKQKKLLKEILDKNENDLINEYNNKKSRILKQILSVENWSNVFIPLLDGWAWDIAYRFIYLKEIFYYLVKKDCSIFIISQEKFSDIILLLKQYFDIKHVKAWNYINKLNDALEQEEVKKTLKEKKGIILDHYAFSPSSWWINLYYKTWNDKRNIFWYSRDFSKYLNESLNCWKPINIKKENYKFDTNRIKNIVSIKKSILCNYESKTFNMPCFDKIDFKTYLKKTYKIWKEMHRKIIINSVYNKEELTENDFISIKCLTFQEVIYLAENNLIDLFISERNWLNDVLFVFYPGIKQIIYYPEGCWFLTKFKKWDLWTDRDYDISLFNLWKIPELDVNVIQDFRKNFLKTVDWYINKLLS